MVTDDGPPPSWHILTVLATVGVVLVALALGLAVLEPKVVDPLSVSDDADPGPQEEIRHVDPRSAAGSGDLTELERQLAEQFADRLRSGGYRLGNISGAGIRDRLGDERFEQLRAEYRDVAIDTGNERRFELLTRASRAQREFTQNVRAYWNLHRTYENLTTENSTSWSVTNPTDREDLTVELDNATVDQSATGSTRNPRVVARSLDRRATAVRESAANAISAYRNLTAYSERNYGSVIRSLKTARQDVTDTQRAVRNEQFVTTNLTLTENRAIISPTRPLATRGRLVDDEGRPIANRTVTFSVGPGNTTVQTDSEGRFDLRYRPVVLRANATELTVRFDPPISSVYLGDAVTLPVQVRQVNPDVSLTAGPGQVEYKDVVRVTGRVAAGVEDLADVPYVVTIDGRVVAANQTGPDGGVEEDFLLGAVFPPGENQLRLEFPVRGRALVNGSSETTIRIRAVETQLALSARPGRDRTARVTGRLATEDGVPVENRTIAFSVGGRLVGTTTTGPNGTYARSVLVPESVGTAGSSIRITGTFEGTGTNLNPSTGTAGVTLNGGGDGFAVPVWLLLGVGLFVAILAVGIRLVRTRPLRRSLDPAAEHASHRPADGGSGSGPAGMTTVLLDRANESAANGRHVAAARAAYAALRVELGGAAELERSRTGWEFYRAYRSDLDDAARGTLRQVTDLYQRATFGGASIDAEDSAVLIEGVQRLTERHGGEDAT